MTKKEIRIITKALVDAKKAAFNCSTMDERIQAAAAVDCVSYDILPLIKNQNDALEFGKATGIK